MVRWLLAVFLTTAACGGTAVSAPVDGGGGIADSASGIDASHIQIVDSGSGGYAACFDMSGQVQGAVQHCQATTDCIMVKHQINCCGDTKEIGITKASADQVSVCEQAWLAANPADCPCDPEPLIDAGTPVLECGDFVGNGGICVVNYQ